MTIARWPLASGPKNGCFWSISISQTHLVPNLQPFESNKSSDWLKDYQSDVVLLSNSQIVGENTRNAPENQRLVNLDPVLVDTFSLEKTHLTLYQTTKFKTGPN